MIMIHNILNFSSTEITLRSLTPQHISTKTRVRICGLRISGSSIDHYFMQTFGLIQLLSLISRRGRS